jgi:serpin B
MARGGGPPPPEEPVAIHADRPFLFFIRDVSSGAILFMGRVADPSAG